MKATSTAVPARPRVAVLALLLVGLVGIGGCAGDTADEAAPVDDGAEVPDWIDRVHPEPGAQAVATPQVQVVHGQVGEREGVRLLVDGTDVTQYAGPRPGVLAYDPNRPQAPVELGPGTHEATALHVSLDEFGEQHEVLDRFEWEFTVQ